MRGKKNTHGRPMRHRPSSNQSALIANDFGNRRNEGSRGGMETRFVIYTILQRDIVVLPNLHITTQLCMRLLLSFSTSRILNERAHLDYLILNFYETFRPTLIILWQSQWPTRCIKRCHLVFKIEAFPTEHMKLKGESSIYCRAWKL